MCICKGLILLRKHWGTLSLNCFWLALSNIPAGLKDTMPAKHKKFLQELLWVYEQVYLWKYYSMADLVQGM